MTETLDRRPLDCTCGWWTEYNNDGEWGGLVTAPDPTCLARPHPERFLTPRHRPDKVEPMTTDEYTTRKVYLENPDIYEADLHNIVQVMDEIKLALNRCEEVFLQDASLVLWNMNGYPIGTLTWEEDFWVFTPHNESDVEANVDVV